MGSEHEETSEAQPFRSDVFGQIWVSPQKSRDARAVVGHVLGHVKAVDEEPINRRKSQGQVAPARIDFGQAPGQVRLQGVVARDEASVASST